MLDDFCSISGQTVNEAKSRVYFSPNVDRDTRESLCDILGFTSTPLLGRFLGFPLKQPGSSSQDFNFVLDKVKYKLSRWKASMLSLASRQVLIQAPSTTIPTYVMQCSYLPSRILDGIDRVNCNFLWGSSDSLKKIHWIGWQKVTKSKEERGLGLQAAKGRNLALLVKLNWRFHIEGDVPWVQVLSKKYCSGRRLSAANPNSLPCSSVWAAMKKGMGTFEKGSRWTVGRESKLSLWYSCWLSKGPLQSLIQGPLSREANNLVIKDFLKDTGWDWNGLSVEFPLDIKLLIQATPIAITSRGCDKIAWADSPQGTFNLSSAYRIAMGHEESPSFSASWIWKANTLPRIKTFLWMCTHNSIGVRSCLMRRGVCEEVMCPICQEVEESILHALRDCPWAKAV